MTSITPQSAGGERELISSDAVITLKHAGVAAMGLSDVLNGMKNGPGGGPSSTSPSGGMSPLTMGLLAFLAYKALKGSGILDQRRPLVSLNRPSAHNRRMLRADPTG